MHLRRCSVAQLIGRGNALRKQEEDGAFVRGAILRNADMIQPVCLRERERGI